MSTRTATCQCGQLSVTCEGEPVRVSVCHCLDCQRRSGSSFAAQARFPVEAVRIEGEHRLWSRASDSGNQSQHHFCPVCGGEVWYIAEPHSDVLAVPIGRFADPAFPAPAYSVYEERKHAWVEITGEGIEHHD